MRMHAIRDRGQPALPRYSYPGRYMEKHLFGHAKTRILSTNKDIMLEALTPTMEGQAVTVTDNHRHLGVV